MGWTLKSGKGLDTEMREEALPAGMSPEGTGIQGWMQCGRTVRDLPEWDRGGQTEAEPGRSDSGSESREDEES